MGIDACDSEHVIIGVDAPGIADGEWPLQCRNGYGSPQVDYLETALQEHRRFVWRKVTIDDVNRGRESLVNVSRRDWLSVVGAVNLTRFVTTNPLGLV